MREATALKDAAFITPNLDALSTDPQEYYDAARVLDKLAQYARRMGVAMEHRAAGRIGDALAVEDGMDELYQQLPKWARW